MSTRDFLLKEATHHERLERDRVSADAWRRKLTVEQYLERLQHLREIPFTQNRIRTFILYRGTLPVASCDTVRLQSEITEPGILGKTEVISRVFVEPGLRGSGYAAELLAQVLTRAREEHVQAVLLFSDLANEKLYARFGFQARRGAQWIYSEREKEHLLTLASKPVGVETIHREHLEAALPSGGLTTQGRLRFSVDVDQLDWHLKRANFYAVAYQKKPIQIVGARTANGDGLAVWAHDFLDQQIQMLWFTGTTPAIAQGLLEAAWKEAAAYGFQRVSIPHADSVSFLSESCRRAPLALQPMILPVSSELKATDWEQLSYSLQF